MTTEQRWQVVGYEKAGGFTQPFVMPEEFGEANRVVVRLMQNSQAVSQRAVDVAPDAADDECFPGVSRDRAPGRRPIPPGAGASACFGVTSYNTCFGVTSYNITIDGKGCEL